MGDEGAQLLGLGARELAAQLVQLREARGHAGADLGVVGGGVELELQGQLVAVPQERHVRRAHVLETLVRGVTHGGRAERLGDSLEGAVRDRQEERLLGAEQAHDVRLRHACALRDAIGRRSVQTTARELDRGRSRDLGSSLVSCLPCRSLAHSLTWYQSITTIGVR